MRGGLSRPMTRNQMEIPGVLDISCGDDAHLHMPSPHPTVEVPWNLDIIQGTRGENPELAEQGSQFERENSDLAEFSQKWLGLKKLYKSYFFLNG